MAELRTKFEGLGFGPVQTILQSGNVVFESHDRAPEALETLFERELGLSVSFHVRTSDEWSQIVVDNPFPIEAEERPNHLLVYCFKSALDPATVSLIQRATVGPEAISPKGRHLYVAFPNGIGDSKIDRTPGWNKLVAGGTARNWNTVLKIRNALSQ